MNEYFAYDPSDPPYWKDGKRLRGWSYENGQLRELEPNEQGWLWSKELNSWLEPDNEYLRLRDNKKKRRLTGVEAERAARKAERASRIAERAAKITAQQQSATDRAALEALLAKLREKNIDPDNL